VKHDLGTRKCILPQLMEHVRLPLTKKNYILKTVIEEPLLKDCHKCKFFFKYFSFLNEIIFYIIIIFKVKII